MKEKKEIVVASRIFDEIFLNVRKKLFEECKYDFQAYLKAKATFGSPFFGSIVLLCKELEYLVYSLMEKKEVTESDKLFQAIAIREKVESLIVFLLKEVLTNEICFSSNNTVYVEKMKASYGDVNDNVNLRSTAIDDNGNNSNFVKELKENNNIDTNARSNNGDDYIDLNKDNDNLTTNSKKDDIYYATSQIFKKLQKERERLKQETENLLKKTLSFSSTSTDVSSLTTVVNQ